MFSQLLKLILYEFFGDGPAQPGGPAATASLAWSMDAWHTSINTLENHPRVLN
jgi:hypothetical protein